MATILTKKKDTSGAPSAGDLTNDTGGAELAVNTADKRLYTKDSGGNVVEVGINPTSITTGTLNTSGAVVFNDAGADVDFRVEGDTEANLLFVDAGNDRVGIGTSSPSRLLNLASPSADTALLRFSRFSEPASQNAFLGAIEFSAYSTGTTQEQGAAILAFSDDAWTSTSSPGRIIFRTTPSGSVTLTERMRITSDGYLRMASGSGGIQFGGDTAAANALDDYEEGTWTPTVSTSNADATVSSYIVRTGTYTKIGRVVYARCTLRATISSAGTGNPTVTGFPYTTVDFTAATITQWDLLGSKPGYTYYEPFGYLGGTTYTFQNSGWTTNPAFAGYLFMHVVYQV